MYSTVLIRSLTDWTRTRRAGPADFLAGASFFWSSAKLAGVAIARAKIANRNIRANIEPPGWIFSTSGIPATSVPGVRGDQFIRRTGRSETRLGPRASCPQQCLRKARTLCGQDARGPRGRLPCSRELTQVPAQGSRERASSPMNQLMVIPHYRAPTLPQEFRVVQGVPGRPCFLRSESKQPHT